MFLPTSKRYRALFENILHFNDISNSVYTVCSNFLIHFTTGLLFYKLALQRATVSKRGSRLNEHPQVGT